MYKKIALLMCVPVAVWVSLSAAQINFVPQVVAKVEGYPVYTIGDLDIYAVSPDFRTNVVIQADNEKPQHKIIPKKSHELRHNYVGATPPRLPRSEIGEEYPFRSIHLIDGDPGTYWRCRPVVAPDLKSEWVRLDLPVEVRINKIILIPTPPRGQDFGLQSGPLPAFPVDFTFQVSRDAWHWETVYEVKNYQQPSGIEPQVFQFSSRQAKQIRLIATRLARAQGDDGRDNFTLTLAEMKVLDTNDNNIALISRGAGVTVSSTDYGYATKRETNNSLWPIHYDLGVKWLKVGYFMDRTNWYHVERVKGRYHVDPVTDAAITDAVENGIEVVLTLCYGNPLYQAYGYSGPQKTYWEMPYIGPLLTKEAIEGYANYCRFMASHFQRRIKYFEIWNNPDGEFALEHDPKPYIETVKAASKAIKEVNPEAKIVLGGMSLMKLDFFKVCFEGGLAPLADVIAWHPYRLALMPEEYYDKDFHGSAFTSYAQWVNALKNLAGEYGFTGKFHANETTYGAAYPQNKKKPIRPDWNYDVSELTKAKYLARMLFIHAALDVPVFWNETWNNQHIYRDVGLLRNTCSVDSDSPMSPQPAYYVMRTCTTTLDGVRPAPMSVALSPTPSTIQVHTFINADGQRLIALWLAIREDDNFTGQEIDVILSSHHYRRIVGIDTLSGLEQELKGVPEGENLRIPDLIIRDYPLVLRLDSSREDP